MPPTVQAVVGVSAGAIGGIVGGVAAFILAAGAAGYVFMHRKRFKVRPVSAYAKGDAGGDDEEPAADGSTPLARADATPPPSPPPDAVGRRQRVGIESESES